MRAMVELRGPWMEKVGGAKMMKMVDVKEVDA